MGATYREWEGSHVLLQYVDGRIPILDGSIKQFVTLQADLD